MRGAQFLQGGDGLLGPGDEAVTGTELSAMDDATFSRRLGHISVYARVQPEHLSLIHI